jgi:hypothetical protein
MPTTLSRLISPRGSLFRLIAALLTLLVGATVSAEPPPQGEGNFFDLTVTPLGEEQVVGANTISVLLLTANTDGTLNGTLSAEVTCAGKTLPHEGSCHGMATFEGDVEGAEGTLLIDTVFRVDGPNLEAGFFTILSGTDALARLKGEGTFSGSLATANGTYTLAFHFHPHGGESSEISARFHYNGTGCPLRRPISWTVDGTYCREQPTSDIELANGQEYVAYSNFDEQCDALVGTGLQHVRCENDGSRHKLVTIAKYCSKALCYHSGPR